MVENYLLEDLVAFAKYGTLAKAAQKLAVTQPALTRSMQKIEAELGVKLFKRQPNRLTLTETGRFAAQEAQKLLGANRAYNIKVKNFAKSHAKIAVAANAPGPLIVLRALEPANITICPKFLYHHFASLLMNKQFAMLLLNHPLKGAAFSSIYLGTEALALNVTEDSPLAKKKRLRFKELTGTTFLVALNVGFWGDIFAQKIPKAKFIYQNKSDEYSALLNHSNLPFFSTNLTPIDKLWGNGLPQDRLTIPFTDKIAHQKFYACFLRENAKHLMPLVHDLQDKWRTMDD